MSKSRARNEIVAMMRANIRIIEKDVCGFLQRECEDLLEAGIDKAALAFGLMQLALHYGTSVAGSPAEMIERLRKVADVFEASEARKIKDQVRH